jgi:hypothetical protein
MHTFREVYIWICIHLEMPTFRDACIYNIFSATMHTHAHHTHITSQYSYVYIKKGAWKPTFFTYPV